MMNFYIAFFCFFLFCYMHGQPTENPCLNQRNRLYLNILSSEGFDKTRVVLNNHCDSMGNYNNIVAINKNIEKQFQEEFEFWNISLAHQTPNLNAKLWVITLDPLNKDTLLRITITDEIDTMSIVINGINKSYDYCIDSIPFIPKTHSINLPYSSHELFNNYPITITPYYKGIDITPLKWNSCFKNYMLKHWSKQGLNYERDYHQNGQLKSEGWWVGIWEDSVYINYKIGQWKYWNDKGELINFTNYFQSGESQKAKKKCNEKQGKKNFKNKECIRVRRRKM